MKVIVNYPQTNEGLEILENNVAKFHATIILETIKYLKVSNEDKKEILKGILKEFKS